jgi:signal transduction histidine kinase
VAGHRAEAQAAGVDLQIVRPVQPETVRTDAARLSHVVGNLVGNAVKFTAARVEGPPGWIRVSVEPVDAARWRLRVADNGIGMSAEVQARMCEEFFQGPTHEEGEDSSGAAPGLGLGLAIVRHLCSALQGELAVESAPGKGAVFTITLPVTLEAG